MLRIEELSRIIVPRVHRILLNRLMYSQLQNIQLAILRLFKFASSPLIARFLSIWNIQRCRFFRPFSMYFAQYDVNRNWPRLENAPSCVDALIQSNASRSGVIPSRSYICFWLERYCLLNATFHSSGSHEDLCFFVPIAKVSSYLPFVRPCVERSLQQWRLCGLGLLYM